MSQARMGLSHKNLILWTLLALVCLLPFSGELYYVKLMTRVLVFALAALSLDLLVGFMGVVSFGHAAFMAVGAYSVGILAEMGVSSIWLAWPLTLLIGAAFAVVIGAISLRCSGLYFIFITLAFAQMLFYGAQSLRAYGGDDGFALQTSNYLTSTWELGNPIVLFYVSLVTLLLCLFISWRLTQSPFGQVVIASRDNAIRLSSMGLRSYRYRLVWFVISGMMCTLAGALLANLTGFIAPTYLAWLVSGELLVMVILGSVGTLIGPILGAAVFVGLEHILSDFTEHWMLIFGPLIVIRVLYLRNGLYGLLSAKPLSESAGESV